MISHKTTKKELEGKHRSRLCVLFFPGHVNTTTTNTCHVYIDFTHHTHTLAKRATAYFAANDRMQNKKQKTARFDDFSVTALFVREKEKERERIKNGKKNV